MKTRRCRDSKPGRLARRKFVNLYIVARTTIETSYVSFCYSSSIMTGWFLALGVLMYSVINVFKKFSNKKLISPVGLTTTTTTEKNNKNKIKNNNNKED
jgi:hypothetical protein